MNLSHPSKYDHITVDDYGKNSLEGFPVGMKYRSQESLSWKHPPKPLGIKLRNLPPSSKLGQLITREDDDRRSLS